MAEESNKFVVKQRVGGTVVAKGKGLMNLDPNVSYDVQITFDGTQFTLIVNSVPLTTFNAAPGLPSGIAGFQVKNTTGTFGSMCVD